LYFFSRQIACHNEKLSKVGLPKFTVKGKGKGTGDVYPKTGYEVVCNNFMFLGISMSLRIAIYR